MITKPEDNSAPNRLSDSYQSIAFSDAVVLRYRESPLGAGSSELPYKAGTNAVTSRYPPNRARIHCAKTGNSGWDRV